MERTNMDSLFKFPLRLRYRYYLNGRRYQLGANGLETMRLLSELHRAYTAANRLTWALPYRITIRRLVSLDCKAALTLVAQTSHDRHMRLLAIWLRGRCGGYTGAPNLAEFLKTDDIQLRKEVVRTLKRIHGWGHLQQLLATEPNKRLRQLATSQPPLPYDNRLSRFSRNVEPQPVSQRRGLFWISDQVNVGDGKPAKPLWLIRELLERIRHLVHKWESDQPRKH